MYSTVIMYKYRVLEKYMDLFNIGSKFKLDL